MQWLFTVKNDDFNFPLYLSKIVFMCLCAGIGYKEHHEKFTLKNYHQLLTSFIYNPHSN